MKTAAFSLNDLKKPTPKKATVKRAPAKQKRTAQQYPAMSPWGREFMRRLDALHKAMDAEGIKKLA